MLRSAVSRLAPSGVIVIQTPHPGSTGGEEDGWRLEDFSGFGGKAWAAMPWYFRSLESWRAVLCEAGLAIRELREPVADGRILSLLMICSPFVG